MIFLLIIFVNYILSLSLVGLWTIRLSVGAGAHIEYSSSSHVEDMTITNVIIKTPERKWDWRVNDVRSGSDGMKSVSWDLTLGETSPAGGYGMLGAFIGSVSLDFDSGPASPAGGYGMRGAFVGSVSWDFDSGPASPAGGYGMRGAFVGSVSWDFDSGPASPAGGYGMRGAFVGPVSWDFDSGPASPAGWLWAM